jgi:hypothetical protein
MERTADPESLDRFADTLARSGVDAVPAGVLRAVVVAARRAGASEVVIGVLVDPTEPPAVRERAFGRVAARVVGAHLRSDRDGVDSAVGRPSLLMTA